MKIIWRVVSAAFVALIALAVLPQAAAAEGPYTSGGVTLSDTTPAPGDSVDVSASGFQPNSSADVFFRSTPILLTSTDADAAGDVAATVTIPRDASGEHEIEIVGVAPDGSARSLSASVTVTADGDPSSGPLPSTGSWAAPTVIVAVLAAIVGVALLVGTRVRRRARSA